MIYNAFTTQEDNSAGIYGIKFYIRGKPWVVDVDDGLVWDTYYAQGDAPAGLSYNKPFDNNGDMWGAVLEKAWGKVKGSIDMSGQGGFVGNGLRSLIGSPHFYYYPRDDVVDDVFALI